VNKEWEVRLVNLSPGNRRRVRIVRKKLAALLPWKRGGKSRTGMKTPLQDPDNYPPLALVPDLRTAPVTVPYRVFRLIRNPAASTLTRGRRLTRATLKVVKSGPGE